jgi:hypothetical protein
MPYQFAATRIASSAAATAIPASKIVIEVRP